MKDWLTVCLQRIEDALHEHTIRKLEREYESNKAAGRLILADAVKRDIERAFEMRSPEQLARIERKKLADMDPHARAAMSRESQA